MKKWFTAFLVAFVCLSAQAQESDMQSLPGYVNFSALDKVYGEPRVRITIGRTLLKFMAAVSKDDPEAAALMRGLVGIRVNVYSTAGEVGAAKEQIALVKTALIADAWEPIVQVQEQNEEVQIFVKTGETAMEGLTVMSVDPDEAVFINILGVMDPSKLAMVMDQLHVDVDVDVNAEEAQ